MDLFQKTVGLALEQQELSDNRELWVLVPGSDFNFERQSIFFYETRISELSGQLISSRKLIGNSQKTYSQIRLTDINTLPRDNDLRVLCRKRGCS